ncbi:MAG: GNAT family N-acetyltransferase [Crocinitomicaceae bacterium]|nr:GNAT family N-acetyltransferase [Crocinitomicaceae bacterium]
MMITIELANIDLLSEAELCRMHSLLVHAYAITEKEIWGDNYSRLSLDEFKELIAANEVYLARLEKEIVGSIHVSRQNDETFSFGLLSADFERKGLGIGRKLIKAVENHAISENAKFMNIEILRPSNIDLPQKKQLDEWYKRQGYIYLNSMSFVERKPDKAEKALALITASQFDCYQKELV